MDRNEYMREYYKQHSDNVKERVRRYRETNSDAVLKTRLKTHSKNPSKINARRVVEAAIKAGVLTKPEACSSCGKKDCRIEAYHEDHTKPLEVDWLCVSCHRKRDSRRRREQGILGKPKPSRKLTDDQVREIRECDLSYSQMAKKYGVSVNVLQKVKAYQTYKDVV